MMLHTAQLIRLDAYCPIKLSYLKAEIRAPDSQADSRILLWLWLYALRFVDVHS